MHQQVPLLSQQKIVTPKRVKCVSPKAASLSCPNVLKLMTNHITRRMLQNIHNTNAFCCSENEEEYKNYRAENRSNKFEAKNAFRPKKHCEQCCSKCCSN